MLKLLIIAIDSMLISNIVLMRFLGICPYIGVSKKQETAAGMGFAVIFVMVMATLISYLLQIYVLNPLKLEYLQTIVFIFVIAALVQIVEITMKKIAPTLFDALGIYLPLITTNCTILGVAILNIQKNYNLIETIVFSLSTGIGYFIAIYLFAGIREKLDWADVPEPFKGPAIGIITAGLMSLAFFGFTGLVKM
ncbi:MAG: electron transport complex subunit RsxA [bacterium]|uniref:Ion-translocating oxidoreductase complex subunit A n=1 Tax=candidate division TA06 bacterium 34_109 TaxID=1635277 RepID=A0A101I1J7_UNCT6|nr:MAG: Putative inner membrane subunit of an electron transport system [candidate division TA06 bacterium 32_111]KUK86945.1 MAG: Putative inner membrane subunit of an electron transport system [candidate division TA06 bacterium 34_109]MDI6700169.1 electron transport complex subunit RsxA [bacterium]HCP16620.1 electron transport complex subunit RsxA [candidate division WOR-3 bacterium]